MKFIFQHRNERRKGNYRNAILRLDSSETETNNFADKLLLLERDNSKLKIALQIWTLSAALHPGTRNQNVLTSSNEATDVVPPLFLDFCWVDSQLQRAHTDIHRRICIPIRFCNFDIREDANNHTTDSYNFLRCDSYTVFDASFQMDYFTWERFFSKVFFRHFVSSISEQRKTMVLSFLVDRLRDGSCTSLVLNTIFLLSTDRIS